MAKRLMPRFLTKEMAQKVVPDMVNLSRDIFRKEFGQSEGCHVVILVPSVEDVRTTGYPDYPNYPIEPGMLYERSFGDKKQWSHPFAEIAKCKALQLWRGQNVDGNMNCQAHLLFSDDTPFWGGVKRQGIVIACSGFKPYWDQMISGMIADALIALARHAYETSEDKAEDRNFLT